MENQKQHSGISSNCKQVVVTKIQLKDISKSILMEPRFDLVTTVDYVLKYLSKKYGCKVEILVKYD